MSTPGFFLVIEGPSGIGKTTVSGLIHDELYAAGVPVLVTQEPSTSPIGTMAGPARTTSKASRSHASSLPTATSTSTARFVLLWGAGPWWCATGMCPPHWSCKPWMASIRSSRGNSTSTRSLPISRSF